METVVAERLPRGIRPTAAGLAAAEEARVALKAAARSVRVGREVGAGRAGCLRIACDETMAVSLLAPVLRKWRSQRPSMQLELKEFSSGDRMIERLARGEADLVVGPAPGDGAEHAEALGQEEMVVVASVRHAFAELDSVTVQEVAREPFVHYDPENGMCLWVDQLAARHQTSLTPTLRTRSAWTAAQLAGAGIGVTIVPASALVVQPSGVVRSLEPPVHRELHAIMAAPSDRLAQRFVADLKLRSRAL
jgi:DNA-binding transcriptional LysR family regulator